MPNTFSHEPFTLHSIRPLDAWLDLRGNVVVLLWHTVVPYKQVPSTQISPSMPRILLMPTHDKQTQYLIDSVKEWEAKAAKHILDGNVTTNYLTCPASDALYHARLCREALRDHDQSAYDKLCMQP